MNIYPNPPASSLEFLYDEETDRWGAATEYNTIFVTEYNNEYEVEVYSSLDDGFSDTNEPEAFFRIESDATDPSQSIKLKKIVHLLEGISPLYLIDALLENIDLIQIANDEI